MSARNHAFDFIRASVDVSTRAELAALVSRSIEGFGANSFLIAGLPNPGEGCSDHVLLNGWAEPWYRRYTSKRYFEIDPVIRLMLMSTSPFQWNAAAAMMPPVRGADAIAAEAAEFDMIDGVTVPIYSRTGDQSGVTFGGRELAADDESLSALRMIAIYAHERAIDLARSDGGPGQGKLKRDLKLAPRELDAVRWAAAGKTSWETAEILGIAKKTVDHLIERSCRKLNARNRVNMVSIAIRNGLI